MEKLMLRFCNIGIQAKEIVQQSNSRNENNNLNWIEIDWSGKIWIDKNSQDDFK